jgi:hypothetical protein
MNENNHKKFAAETMIDVTKLLVTLASGFFVLSTTLINILSDGIEDPLKAFWSLSVAWLCLILSITTGILALGGIATSAHDHGIFDVDAIVTKWMLRSQQVLFILAFIFVAWFAYANH